MGRWHINCVTEKNVEKNVNKKTLYIFPMLHHLFLFVNCPYPENTLNSQFIRYTCSIAW